MVERKGALSAAVSSSSGNNCGSSVGCADAGGRERGRRVLAVSPLPFVIYWTGLTTPPDETVDQYSIDLSDVSFLRMQSEIVSN